MKPTLVPRLAALGIGALALNVYAADFVLRPGANNINNSSPELSWQGEPTGTRSFAVTIYDSDVPPARGRNRWTIFNIDSGTHHLERGGGTGKKTQLPAGSIQSRNDFNRPEYTEICPVTDAGKHHIVINVWALNVHELPLDAHVSPAIARLFIRQHQLARAKITITCGI